MDIPLLENGSSIVDATFLSSLSPEPPASAKVINPDATIVPAIDKVAIEFNELADQDTPDRERPLTDAKMSELLHRELRLTLFQASQHQFWHYVAVVKCPRYVSWRWFNSVMNSVPKRQYVGPWYRNAFGRLWWWAEYTHDPSAGEDQYVRTIRAGQSQEFMRNTIENSLCGNRALVKSLCDAAFPMAGTQMKDEQHRELIKRVNAMLVTIALDTLQSTEIEKVVKEVVKEMNISDESALNPKAQRKRGFFGRLVGR